jgi:Yip1 domain
MSVNLLELARLTLTQPRQGLRSVLNLGLPRGAGTAGLVLMAVLSALLLHLSLRISPVPAGNEMMEQLIGSPFRTAIVQAVVLMGTALLVYRIGRAFGGRGTIEEAILAMVWLQTILVALQGLQLLALILLPPLASLIGMLSGALFLWLMTQFITELHGFQSAAKVFFGVIVTFILATFVISFLLIAIIGPGAFGNV